MRGINRLFKPRGYLEGIKRRFAGSSLNLNFISGAQSLDNRVTFSRASNATLVGPDGTIQYAPHNLLTHSEQFDNAAWVRSGGETVSANAQAAPDGQTTADRVQIGVSSFAQTTASGALPPTAFQTFSVYIKAGEIGFAQLRVRNVTATANYVRTIINLSTGELTSTGNFGNGSGASALASPAANGYWRVSISGVPDTSGTSVSCLVILMKDATGTVASAANSSATDGLFLWGAQLNVGALQPYYPTTVKNLLGYSQEFDNAAWTKNNATVTANAAIAPDGSLTADKLVEGTATAQPHVLPASSNLAWVANTPSSTSVYAKAGERRWLRIWDDSSPTPWRAWFDLDTGVLGSVGSSSTATIQDVGNGWYRCSLFHADTTTAIRPRIGVADADGGTSYTGDGMSGIYIWGAQLSDSASLDPYIYNPGAAPAAQAYYGPRFDHDPATLAPKGLLIEEQRTNLWMYSNGFDNSAWGKIGGDAITPNAVTSPNGTPNGFRTNEATASGAGHGVSQISASLTSGTSYTVSVYVKDIPTSAKRYVSILFSSSGFGGFKSVVFDASTGVGYNPSAGVVYGSSDAGNGWRRVWASLAATATTTSGADLRITSSTSDPYANQAGSPANGLYLFGAQLEAGALPTSYIPTTTAAATRAADGAVMTGTNFSSWYRQDEGTLFAETQVSGYSNASNPRLVALAGANSATERIEMFVAGGSPNYRAVIRTNGVDELLQNVVSAANIYEQNKWAIAYKTNDSVAFGRNGNNTDTFVNLPAINSLDFSASFSVVKYIRRIAYFPRRLANSELQALTT